MLTLGSADYTLPEYEGHFRHNGLFLGPNVRPAVAAGRADYTPICLSEIEKLFWSGEMPLDVALIQTSPPDEHGYLSLGTSIDCTLTAARVRALRHRGSQRPDAAHAGRYVPAREQSLGHRGDFAPAAGSAACAIERRAEPHRAERGVADPRWRHAAARHRRHSQCRAGIALRPQGSRHSQRDVPGWRGAPDRSRRHHRRPQDAAPGQSRRGLCVWHEADLRFHPQQPDLRIPSHRSTSTIRS